MAGLIICGTGHRPEDCEPEAVVRRKIRNALEEINPRVVITGMASGYDLWLGIEAIDYGSLVWAAKPWAGHKPRNDDKSQYEYVIEGASKVVEVNVSAVYLGPWMYHNRNEWMVDNSNEVLAYWSGKESGGTYACLQYAKNKMRKVTNIYERL